MSAFDTAKKFFEARENGLGFEGCKTHVVPGATFAAPRISDDKVEDRTQVWNAARALKELGWA